MRSELRRELQTWRGFSLSEAKDVLETWSSFEIGSFRNGRIEFIAETFRKSSSSTLEDDSSFFGLSSGLETSSIGNGGRISSLSICFFRSQSSLVFERLRVESRSHGRKERRTRRSSNETTSETRHESGVDRILESPREESREGERTRPRVRFHRRVGGSSRTARPAPSSESPSSLSEGIA